MRTRKRSSMVEKAIWIAVCLVMVVVSGFEPKPADEQVWEIVCDSGRVQYVSSVQYDYIKEVQLCEEVDNENIGIGSN